MKEQLFENADAYKKYREKKTKLIYYIFTGIISTYAITISIFQIIGAQIISGRDVLLFNLYRSMDYIRIIIFAFPFSLFLNDCCIRYNNKSAIYTENSIYDQPATQLTNFKLLSKIASRYIKIKNDEHFRARYFPWVIASIVMSCLGIISAISTFASNINTLVIVEKSTTRSLSVALGFMHIIFILTASIFALLYIKDWLWVYRWEYEELSLTPTEKQELIASDNAKYKQYKQEQKQLKQTAKLERQKQLKVEQENIKNKQKFDSDKYETSPSKMTKLDKLKELDDLLQNNVITQDEYEKARAEILGK